MAVTRVKPAHERYFGDVFEREYPRLVQVAHALTGKRDLAEEVAQESLVSAWRRWNHVAELERPDLWLRRAAVNRCISLHRRAVAEVAALAKLHNFGSRSHHDELPDAELWSAVRRLGTHQRVAVVLSAVEERTAAEIGEVLGCSAETAQTHIRRGRARLAEWLGDDE